MADQSLPARAVVGLVGDGHAGGAVDDNVERARRAGSCPAQPSDGRNRASRARTNAASRSASTTPTRRPRGSRHSDVRPDRQPDQRQRRQQQGRGTDLHGPAAQRTGDAAEAEHDPHEEHAAGHGKGLERAPPRRSGHGPAEDDGQPVGNHAGRESERDDEQSRGRQDRQQSGPRPEGVEHRGHGAILPEAGFLCRGPKEANGNAEGYVSAGSAGG